MAKVINWLTEKEAADKIQRKPRTLRKLVLNNRLAIAYTNINGRRYQYSENDINTLLLKNSTIVN